MFLEHHVTRSREISDNFWELTKVKSTVYYVSMRDDNQFLSSVMERQLEVLLSKIKMARQICSESVANGAPNQQKS